MDSRQANIYLTLLPKLQAELTTTVIVLRQLESDMDSSQYHAEEARINAQELLADLYILQEDLEALKYEF